MRLIRAPRGIWLLLLAGLLILTAGRTRANGTILVSPARYILQTQPRGIANGSILVVNQSAFEVTVTAVFRDWDLSMAGTLVASEPGSLSSSCAGWIRFNPRVFKIPAGGRQIVRYSVTIPAGTPVGERRGVIFFEQRSLDPSGSGARLVTQIGSVLYVAIGAVDRRFEMRGLQADPGAGRRLKLTIAMAAAGNGHCRPSGCYAVWNSQKTRVESGVIPETLMLPGQAKTLEVTGTAALPAGQYRISVELFSPGSTQVVRRDLTLQMP